MNVLGEGALDRLGAVGAELCEGEGVRGDASARDAAPLRPPRVGQLHHLVKRRRPARPLMPRRRVRPTTVLHRAACGQLPTGVWGPPLVAKSGESYIPR